jgi:hypothetical protein
MYLYFSDEDYSDQDGRRKTVSWNFFEICQTSNFPSSGGGRSFFSVEPRISECQNVEK